MSAKNYFLIIGSHYHTFQTSDFQTVIEWAKRMGRKKKRYFTICKVIFWLNDWGHLSHLIYTIIHHYQRSDGCRGPHGGQVNDVGGNLRLAPVLEEVDVEVDGAV